LIRTISRDNPLWGTPRIHGELLKLSIDIAQSTVAKYMSQRRGPRSPGWQAFLRNHTAHIAGVDLFVVPTVGFQLLYGLVILRLERRRLVWTNVTAEWIARQITEAMAGLREFVVQFGTEEQCIEHLAGLRWPGGFACAGCGGRQTWRLKTRPRVYECATCHRQESATAGTVFHRTRTDVTKWFLAAYLMGRDKRGVSAKFLQRELGVAYQTAWTMAHKLRHGLSEDPSRPLHGFLETAEPNG
jgi:transposase-like protein